MDAYGELVLRRKKKYHIEKKHNMSPYCSCVIRVSKQTWQLNLKLKTATLIPFISQNIYLARSRIRMSVHNVAQQHIVHDFISYVLPRLNTFTQAALHLCLRSPIHNNLHEHVNKGGYTSTMETCYIFLLLFFFKLDYMAAISVPTVEFFSSAKLQNSYVDWKMSPEPVLTKKLVAKWVKFLILGELFI